MLLLFLLMSVCCSRGFAQDYCSLKVRVLSPDGRRPMVTVSVQEKSGRTEEQDQKTHDVEFCDLGGLPVTVKVGEDGCNQVVVRDVPVSWGEPYVLKITYDHEPCLRDLPPPPVPVCRVVFRVSDSSGKWVPAAIISLTSPDRTELKTDRFGRTTFVSRRGVSIVGKAAQAGRSAGFAFQCQQNEPVHEELLTLGNAR